MSNDPTYTPSVEREARPPRLDLLERCWRLRALPTGRELENSGHRRAQSYRSGIVVVMLP